MKQVIAAIVIVLSAGCAMLEGDPFAVYSTEVMPKIGGSCPHGWGNGSGEYCYKVVSK